MRSVAYVSFLAETSLADWCITQTRSVLTYREFLVTRLPAPLAKNFLKSCYLLYHLQHFFNGIQNTKAEYHDDQKRLS